MQLSSTGSTVNPHTYVGRERYYLMSGADLYHLGFRDYAQALGRFMTVDPSPQGVSRMVYVGNLSLVQVDPRGTDGLSVPRDIIDAHPLGYAYSKGPRFPAHLHTCPAYIQSEIGTMCGYIAGLNAGQLAAINDCVSCNANRMGIFCMSLSLYRLDCMRKWCDGRGRVECLRDDDQQCLGEDMEGPTLNCGFAQNNTTSVKYDCQVGLCIPRVEGNPACGCISDPGIPSEAFTFLHELAHCCGIQHGTAAGKRPRRSCNDVWACCIYNVIHAGRWRKSDASEKHGCRLW